MTLSKNPEIAKRQRKRKNEASKKRDAAKWKQWRAKYPDLKRITYIGKNQAELMGLPLRHGDPREKDNRTFNLYYCRCSGTGPQICEQWTLPKTKEKQNQNNKKRKSIHAARIRRFIKRYKKLVGCTICGWNESTWGLHFDHIDPNNKNRDISKMIGYSIHSLKEEMRKCRLVCANCHASHTEKQASSGKYSWSQGK